MEEQFEVGEKKTKNEIEFKAYELKKKRKKYECRHCVLPCVSDADILSKQLLIEMEWPN